jgi:lactaldehyde dehydrogenase
MQMLIAGEWCDASDGGTIEIINPGTGALIDRVPAATEADVARAVEAAGRARHAMAAMPAHARAEVLFRTADRMAAEQEELSRLLAEENGKPIRQTREEVGAAIRIVHGFGEEAKRLFGRQVPMDAVPGSERHVAFTIRQPIGVVFAVVPFNYPVELYAHKVGAALGAGNAIIGKPPSDCPLALLRVARILEESGLPPGAHQMLTGRGSVIGPRLAADRGVNMVTLTGSVETGVELGRIAAEHMKPFHAELGGNDASIVCADADLELAARGILMGRLARGNGQICCSVKRVFVDRRVADAFADELARQTAELKVGDQLDEDCDVGPLISEEAARRVVERVEAAVSAGATLVAGGTREGAFVAPTIISGVALDEPLICEETFGPVVPIVAFDAVDEAVAMANDSAFGLQAAVFTRDLATAMRVAHALEAGGVIVNWSSAVRSENLPFGGLKMSGHGRESLHDTMLAMTEQKAILFHDILKTGSPPEAAA